MPDDPAEVPGFLNLNNLELLFSTEVGAQSDLNDLTIPEALRQRFEDKKNALSKDASVSVKKVNSEWLINDGDNVYTVKKQEDKLNIYYPRNIEDTYLRLLKNQRDLGRPDKSLYIAMKRHQRAQKFLPVRWIERFLFDFPTKYGTASFPLAGVFYYVGGVLFVFTALYCGINKCLRPRHILEYYIDGGKVDSQRKLGTMDIFWFSLNAFIPAVKFVNVEHWRITDERFLRIKCSTLATVESILGWLLIPILLRYFRT